MRKQQKPRELQGKFTLILAILLPFVALTACEKGSELPSNVTRLVGHAPGHNANPSWLNDHEVLFLGHAGPGRNSVPYGIFIWDTRSMEVELYRPWINNLCYFDGAISYVVVRDNEGEWLPRDELETYFGKFGEEKDVPLPDDHRLSRFTCSPVRSGEEIDGWQVTPLLAGDGYYQGPNLAHQRGIYNASRERVAELPPKSHLGFQYLPWSESYFFSEAVYGEHEGKTATFVDYEPGVTAVKHIVRVPVIGWTQGFLKVRDKLLMRVNDSDNPEVKGIYSFDEDSGDFPQIRKGYVDISEHPLRGYRLTAARLRIRMRFIRPLAYTVTQSGIWK